MMDVRLVLEKGKSRARLVHLRSEETIIGRRHDCDLRILSSQVSRRHCLLSIHDGYLTVEDLDSVNGTLVNGKRVAGKQPLRPGDRLEVGPLRFTVEYEITQDALDRLEKEEAASNENLPVAVAVDEDAAEVAQVASEDDDEELDVVPLSDEETALVPVPKEGARPVEDSGAPIPVGEELDEDADWALPESADLRDILSEMENKESRSQRKPR
jgi:predicted component of type VI protein secretion system